MRREAASRPLSGLDQGALDETHMRVALEQAQVASQRGEVPVGAALYQGETLIAQAHNSPISLCDPSAHAEILVLKEAAKVLGNYRLEDCTLYVTLEPCAMCAGAIFNARVREVVYAAPDAKSGAAGSVIDLFANAQLNHHARIRGGVLKQQSVSLLQDFFKEQRRLQRLGDEQLSLFLREDAIRKPMQSMPGFHGPSCSSSHLVLRSTPGMRLHYLQAHAKSAVALKTYVCLHGVNTCSSVFDPLLQNLCESGASVLAPDMMGYGGSDRFKKSQSYDFALAMRALLEWMDAKDLQELTLITHDASLVWALVLKALRPQQVVSVMALNPCLKDEPGLLAPRGLYARWGAWLKKGSRTQDLQAHFAALLPHLSEAQLQALSSPFAKAFERKVFEAFDVLFPGVEEALSLVGLAWSDLSALLTPQFLSQCLVLNTQACSLVTSESLKGGEEEPMCLGFSPSEALLGHEFLSPACFEQLGRWLQAPVRDLSA
jgi:tRNA(adenine34) deaminase